MHRYNVGFISWILVHFGVAICTLNSAPGAHQCACKRVMGNVLCPVQHCCQSKKRLHDLLDCYPPHLFLLALQMPAGILYVKVVEAVNVPNMDWFSKTDAYVVLFVRGRRKRRTKIAWNSLLPR